MREQIAKFITPNRQYPTWLYPGTSDIDKLACPQLSWTISNFSYYEPWTWHRVITEIENSETDCVLVPYWSGFHLPFLSYLFNRLKKPIFTVIHNFKDHETKPMVSFFSEKILRKSSGFFHHNPDYNALPFFESRKDRVFFHPLPAFKANLMDKLEARTRLGIPQNKTYFLFFGLIRPYKGLETLLEALKTRPNTEEIGLLVAGEPWTDSEILLKKIERLPKNLFKLIRLQWIPEEDAPIWFSATDAVILPYLKASSSAIAAQALAYGKPILGTQTGSLKEVVQHNVNGLLCEPNSPEQLNTILTSFLDPQIRKRLTVKTDHNDFFSWESYTEALNNLANSSYQSLRTEEWN
jgi:glycosyltransferase involved in cell wall biosynthesis